ncbi:HPP family protein [Duganella sp. LX20W]|uniref:HPP family protein n=1 Tax=Rugamonas brunnea TaxID=2758569 RepID=A0A7W2I9Z3_9BURK|nr:HPP family protein [Rugamonas brunnea]MBA5635831.1 HPP family protein [Rugamonas brunnea]
MFSLTPAAIHLNNKERLRSCLGALIGIALTAGLTRLAVGANSSLPLLLAPMGASAVLLFAVPASPLSQPWSIIGGNLVSALVGVACVRAVGDSMVAATMAVPLAIAAMFYLRCVHPPSGAVALTAVLGGTTVHGLGYGFVLAPVGLNSVALLASALVYHRLTGHRYPHRAASGAAQVTERRTGFTRADLEEALAQHGEMLDVEAEDLQTLFNEVEIRAYRRHMENLFCADVMTTAARTVRPETTADAAWNLLREHQIKALPVIDDEQRVIGIVTQTDFVVHAHAHAHAQVSAGLPGTVRLRPRVLVRDIMSGEVKTAHLLQPISELVPMFASYGHHHLPVVDTANRLRGMVTQANLVAGLYQKSLDQMIARAA